MDDKNNTDKVGELLTNWSKWLITINMFAATGCVVGLKTAGDAAEKTGKFFFAAIGLFGFSIICATLFVFLLAQQNLYNNNNTVTKFIWLAKLQWLLFIAGLVFVLLWIGFLSKVF
jgi:hypothetical protein